VNAISSSEFSYDPFSPAAMQDPLSFYKILRRDHPVYALPQYDSFAFSRFGDVHELLSHVDNSFLQSEGSLPTPEALRVKNSGAPALPADDPLPISVRFGLPLHGDIRRAHFEPLAPRNVHKLEALVRKNANERLDALLPQGRFDLTQEYGGIVAARTIMHLMGMPEELADRCLKLVNGAAVADQEHGGVDTGAGARACVQTYLPYVKARMEAGADGSVPMVDGMINYRYNGRALTPGEVATQLVCAFIGGIESVPKVAAHGLMELANHPDQLAAVRANLKANVPTAVEEMVRYCAPAQWFVRTAHKPIVVAGQKIEPGQRAFALIASANRDEREFENPDAFVWNRPIRRTLAFGYGMHICIGAYLARMEVGILVKTFLERVPHFSFDMAAASRPPSSFQWGWSRLPVVIG
jgi:cytochrome P450